MAYTFEVDLAITRGEGSVPTVTLTNATCTGELQDLDEGTLQVTGTCTAWNPGRPVAAIARQAQEQLKENGFSTQVQSIHIVKEA